MESKSLVKCTEAILSVPKRIKLRSSEQAMLTEVHVGLT